MTTASKCNKCGLIMDFEERKYIFVEVVGGEKGEPMDIHICPFCRTEVVDFINEPVGKQKRNKFGRFVK